MAAPPRKNVPGKRSWARRCALQALYQWQLTDQEPRLIANQFLADEDHGKARARALCGERFGAGLEVGAQLLRQGVAIEDRCGHVGHCK